MECCDYCRKPILPQELIYMPKYAVLLTQGRRAEDHDEVPLHKDCAEFVKQETR